MSSERTPLLDTIPTAPPRQRYPHQALRKVCTALLVGALAIGLPVVVFFVVSTPNGERRLSFGQNGVSSSPMAGQPTTSGLEYKQLVDIVVSTPNEDQVREWSKYYTAGPHLMGRNRSQAEWTRDRWKEFGVEDIELVAYDVYTNYPKTHRLALLEGASRQNSEVVYEASLEEDVLEEDHTTGLPDRVPTFHGYSASGNVTAQYVYCNYGTYKDYEDLLKGKIDLNGKIALVRYGNIFRGLKVKRAQELGMVGVVMYSDPGDDPVQSFDPEHQYPNGPARNPSSVQRGSAQFLSFGPGDPTTPGYPSKPGAPRQDTDYAIAKIPSLPISYKDALPILKSLNGHGPDADSFGSSWRGGGLGAKGVEYNIGPSPAGLALNLVNDVEYVITPMWNVVGVINGTNSDEVVILGNHRDAWIAGGAADPNSGSAAFNEVIRGFGKALKAGWKPRRTIVFASWDGEEYGLVGSTEWVEEYIPWLTESAVAYLNVDVGTSGPDFNAAAAPLLDHVLIETTNDILSPNQTLKGQKVGDVWDGHIKTMGSGSDFTAFQDFAGIPSIDLGFGPNPSAHGTEGRPVYHYHSNYDSFHWMDKFGDPGWHYHATIAKLWGLLTAKIVEDPIIPFNATNYAAALARYTESVEEMVSSSQIEMPLSLKKLRDAVGEFKKSAIKFDVRSAELRSILSASAGDVPYAVLEEVKSTNNAYKFLERRFLYKHGLDKRSWFKHTVFAPGKWTGYAGATFPGLVESAEEVDPENFYRWQDIIVDEVLVASASLKVKDDSENSSVSLD